MFFLLIIKIIGMQYNKFGEKKHIIIGAVYPEKPIKKNKNFGNILILLNFQYHYGIEWKKFSFNHKIPCYLEKFFREILGLKKIDLRDLCLKRGNIVKNLKITIFLEKNMMFASKNFICNYFVPFLKKELVVHDFIKYQQVYSRICEKNILKRILTIDLFSKEIEKLTYQEVGKIKYSKEFILKSIPQYCNNSKNILILKDITDINIENFNLLFLLFKWISKKKENFLRHF